METTPIRDGIFVTSPRIAAGPSSHAWLCLFAEFFIGLVLSCCFELIDLVKSMLPKPPRDLGGNVVLVAGATSKLGRSIADEFARNGCAIVCVDGDIKELERVKTRLPIRSRRGLALTETIDTDGEGRGVRRTRADGPSPHGCYECDLGDKNCIKNLAARVKDDFGGIDVLVTCADAGVVAGAGDAHIVDKINAILMTHYWTILALLPALMKRERAHVVAVTPVSASSSSTDTNAGSRAAIAGLMESLTRESNGGNEHLNFITVTPCSRDRANGWPTGRTDDEEKRVAGEIVQAVRRADRCALGGDCWYSLPFYRTSWAIHAGITTIARWFGTRACDRS